MPAIPKRNPAAERILPAGWMRSKKGNLYRRYWNGTTVTVFCYRSGRREGLFGHCVFTDDEGVMYADDAWDTEQEAMEAADDEYEG